MKVNTLKYFFIDALKSLKRDRTLSVTAVITVLVTPSISGTFALLRLNFNKTVEDVALKVEIKAFLRGDIKLLDQKGIEMKLSKQEGAKEVIHGSREEASANFKESPKGNSGLLQGYDLQNNPLPSSFMVKLENPKYANIVSNTVKDMNGVENISNQQDMINTISKLVGGVKIAGLILFAIFTGASMFLITNTTKITAYTRRKEAGIMKFVGAIDWFIRWPFIIEGMIIDTVDSLLASLLLFGLYKWAYGYIVSNMFLATLAVPGSVLGTLTWVFLLGGIVAGAIGGIVTLRKLSDV